MAVCQKRNKMNNLINLCYFWLAVYNSIWGSLWAYRPRRPSHQTSSWKPGILRRWSCGVEQSAHRHSICTNTLHLQESAQDSFVVTVVFCTLSFINLIRVAYVVRRPCSDYGHVTAPYKLSYYYYYYYYSAWSGSRTLGVVYGMWCVGGDDPWVGSEDSRF